MHCHLVLFVCLINSITQLLHLLPQLLVISEHRIQLLLIRFILIDQLPHHLFQLGYFCGKVVVAPQDFSVFNIRFLTRFRTCGRRQMFIVLNNTEIYNHLPFGLMGQGLVTGDV